MGRSENRLALNFVTIIFNFTFSFYFQFSLLFLLNKKRKCMSFFLHIFILKLLT